MRGYIKVYRKVLNSQMYKHLTSKQRDVMWVCLLCASHCENEWEWEGNIFKCSPGQFITSVASIKKKCASDVSIKNIRTALLKLERWQFLAIKTAKTGRLITVVNWDEYQIEEKNGQSKRQLSGKQAATIKNDKNDKNDKEVLFNQFWDLYQKDIDKEIALKIWFTLTDEEHKKIIDYVPAYVQSIPEKTYRKNPTTFLNNQAWNNEIICLPQPPINNKDVKPQAGVKIYG